MKKTKNDYQDYSLFLKRAFRNKRVLAEIPPRVISVLSQIELTDFNFTTRLPFPSMFLFGNYETGKTVVACKQIFHYLFACREASKEGKQVDQSFHFLNYDKLATIVQTTDYGKERFNQFKKFLSCGLLIIDDIHSFKNSDYTYEILSHIVNHRYDYQLPIIFTSNHNVDLLGKKFNDARMASRITRIVNEKNIYEFKTPIWKEK